MLGTRLRRRGKIEMVNTIKSILFDLDGTLTDSGPGITKGVQYALKKFNINITDLTSLRRFIGPPLTDSFSKYYQFDLNKANQALQYYREYYSEIGIFENNIYYGINELLGELQSKNISLYIATSKPTIYARKVCDYFDISKYFVDIQGSDLNENLSNKTKIIKLVMQKNKLINDETIMIGDREHDVIGAKNNNIKCIGVGYGYGSENELLESGAFLYVNNVDELAEIILGKNA